MPAVIHKKDLLYPELSYQIVGCAYDVFNELGFGHPEKFYQRAFAEALKKKKYFIYRTTLFPDKV